MLIRILRILVLVFNYFKAISWLLFDVFFLANLIVNFRPIKNALLIRIATSDFKAVSWTLFDVFFLYFRCCLLHRTAGDTERRYHLRYYKTGMCVHDTDNR